MSFSIIGTGRATPACVITNDDLSKILDTSDEWISTRTGIHQRHICTTEGLTDLGLEAANKALSDAGIQAKELDLIIGSTMRGDYMTPSFACVLQELTGAVCPAFDLNAACSGFLYALDVAQCYFAAKRAKKILIVAGEVMSKLIDWEDRSTCVLFGDGAGAAVLSEGDDLLSLRLTARGNTDSLGMPNLQGNCPYNETEQSPMQLYMNGQDVYKFAVTNMCEDLTYVISEAGLKEDNIDWVLPHQANIRIIKAAQSRLNIPKEKYMMHIQYHGNTSSASIPMMLDELNRDGKIKKGDLFAMSAFGAGFTTGAGVMRWSK